MQLCDPLLVCPCHRHEHMVSAAGVIAEPLPCLTYVAGFEADPSSLMKLLVTSWFMSFREQPSELGVAPAPSWELNYSAIPVSAVLIAVLIIEPDWPHIPVLQSRLKRGLSCGLSGSPR